ncbi:uncharacterized protein M421DRAFT_425543 [Didymella exigua CBS 183.55]|uniref:Uncharacterized protein n=1 Tax=Didymella exigua CBS 183.55 TaxID=1150837 RepID=A0A6A5R8V2_9PLEO|nr:uncharacterized protein M421DRAFT_425543 [Didymella exigua CBS 183.55]KAF1923650.1 hypothetical protein M421DRAFT_425543 [Didymella exigua CBS 183.55]
MNNLPREHGITLASAVLTTATTTGLSWLGFKAWNVDTEYYEAEARERAEREGADNEGAGVRDTMRSTAGYNG